MANQSANVDFKPPSSRELWFLKKKHGPCHQVYFLKKLNNPIRFLVREECIAILQETTIGIIGIHGRYLGLGGYCLTQVLMDLNKIINILGKRKE